MDSSISPTNSYFSAEHRGSTSAHHDDGLGLRTQSELTPSKKQQHYLLQQKPIHSESPSKQNVLEDPEKQGFIAYVELPSLKKAKDQDLLAELDDDLTTMLSELLDDANGVAIFQVWAFKLIEQRLSSSFFLSYSW